MSKSKRDHASHDKHVEGKNTIGFQASQYTFERLKNSISRPIGNKF